MAPALDCYTTAGNDLLTCLLDDSVAAFGGEAMMGTVIGAAIILAGFWANDGRMGTPAVIVIVSGGLLVPLLPAPYAGVARAIMFIGLVAAAVAVGQRYLLREPL